jgi:hypothetical protein
VAATSLKAPLRLQARQAKATTPNITTLNHIVYGNIVKLKMSPHANRGATTIPRVYRQLSMQLRWRRREWRTSLEHPIPAARPAACLRERALRDDRWRTWRTGREA